MTLRELRPLLKRFFTETSRDRFEVRDGYLLTAKGQGVLFITANGRAAIVSLASKPDETPKLVPLGHLNSADFKVYRRAESAEGGETYLPEA